MQLSEVMNVNGGIWENDTAVVKVGAYHVRVATRVGDKVTILEEGLRSFPV